MARILGVGAAALDIITTVGAFPCEDSDTRAQEQTLCAGGNVPNSLRVLAQLGHACQFVGVFGDDLFSDYLRSALSEAGIQWGAAPVSPGRAPVSQILVNAASGSRTIVHFRGDLPELGGGQLCGRASLTDIDWLHVEARTETDPIEVNLQQARQAAPRLPISLEVEKPRPRVERLYEYADVIFFSRDYAEAVGHDCAVSLLRSVESRTAGRLRTCTWGRDGAYALDPQGNLYHSPAVVPSRVVDTTGAGDTFNAGFIDARVRGLCASESLARACALAGKKCGQLGLSDLVCGGS